MKIEQKPNERVKGSLMVHILLHRQAIISTSQSTSSCIKMPLGSRQKKDVSPPRGPSRGAPRILFEDPPKKVYLIRHGESVGQTKPPSIRTKDDSLHDCPLTQQGEHQAGVIPSVLGLDRYREIDCVFSSPLTRALQTSVLGFPSKSIYIVYDIMEIGNARGPIPENRGRPLAEVIAETGGKDRIFTETFAPVDNSFPKSHENIPVSVSQNKLKKVWAMLWEFCYEQKYREVAVVCHSMVIRSSIQNHKLRPQNGVPIECSLYPNGRLEVDEVMLNPVEEMSNKIADLKRQNKWLMDRDDSSSESSSSEDVVGIESGLTEDESHFLTEKGQSQSVDEECSQLTEENLSGAT